MVWLGRNELRQGSHDIKDMMTGRLGLPFSNLCSHSEIWPLFLRMQNFNQFSTHILQTSGVM